jgi:hypothetical protein
VSRPTELHIYRCSFCRTLTSASVKAPRVYQCAACGRWLEFQWSEPIRTAEDEALAARGVVPWGEPRPSTPGPRIHRCQNTGVCSREIREPDQHLYEHGLGFFCSEQCHVDGVRKYRELVERMRKLREEQPEMFPADKQAS